VLSETQDRNRSRDHAVRPEPAFNDRGFDPNRRDITDITLWADGRGRIMLRSWGDAVLWLTDLRCDSAGFMSAIEREGNGTSMVTLSFRRETY